MSEKTIRALLINPKMPYTIWSFPECCRLTGVKATDLPLGLITMAALLPKHWQLRLVDQNTRDVTETDWNWAQLVMVTGMIVQVDSMAKIIKAAKSRGKTVVAGGPITMSSPEEVLEMGSDYLIKGEAENILPQFLQTLETGGEPKIFQDEGKPDLIMSPIPRYDLLDLRDYDALSIQTSRGCPYDCEFCDIVSIYGRKPRYKSPDQVMSELEYIYQLGWRGSIFVVDDNFIGNKKNARAILQKLIPWQKSHGEPFVFTTQASLDLGQDLELIDLMTEASMGLVFVGLESPNQNVLSGINKHQNVSNPMVDSINNMIRNGLIIQGSFIIGFDREEPGTGARLVEFVEATKIPFALINLIMALPNTKLWKRMEFENRLFPNNTVKEYLTKLEPNFVTSRPLREVQKDYLDSWINLYEPSRYLSRIYRFCLTIRPTRAALAKINGLPREKNSNSRQDLPARKKVYHTLAFFRIVWRQGLRRPTRWQFWRQLINMIRKNPSRLRTYFILCAWGEDLIRFRKEAMKVANHKSLL